MTVNDTVERIEIREANLQNEITRQHHEGGVRLTTFLAWQEAVRELQGRPSQASNLNSARELMRRFGLNIIDDCGSA